MSQLPPPPPPYVYGGPNEKKPANGSLYADGPSLFEDTRARRINDIVTIRIVEKISGTSKTETKSDKKDSQNEKLDDFFGLTTTNRTNNMWGNGVPFTPTYKSTVDNKFDTKGRTLQDSSIVGSISARVVQVLPNGNLAIDSRKEIKINDENQILVLQGMVRPDDVDADNVVLSTKVADARLFLVGDGFLTENQAKGWMGRFFNKIKPF